MPRLAIDRFDPPSSAHAARVRAWAGQQATDELAGRHVWCASASERGHGLAVALAERLAAGAGGVTAEPLVVDEGEAVRELARRLDALLGGLPAGADAPTLGAADRAGCAEATAAAEAAIARSVGVDDVVLVHDAASALAAQAMRARGAHVVWHLQIGGRGQAGASPSAEAALEFLRPFTGMIDAYISSTAQRARGDRRVVRVAALMPGADLLATKELFDPEPRGALAWRAALADVVVDDRAQHVGGRVHVRPAVAVR
jgi:hypothetical protein